jgi:hypothetical protein
MTKREVLSISFKLIGIWCLSIFISMMVNYWNSFSILFMHNRYLNINPYANIISAIVLILWQVGLVYLFFRYSDYLAERLILNDTAIAFSNSNQLEKTLFPLSLTIIGIGCFIAGGTDIIRNLSRLFNRTYGQATLMNFDRTVGSLVLLAFGAYLFTGGEHLVALAFKEKRKPEPEEPDDRDT